MVSLERILSLAIITMEIISLSHCQSISNVGESNMSIYSKFMTRTGESSTLKNTIIMIKGTPGCSTNLVAIVDQIIELYTSGENLLCIVTKNSIQNDCCVNNFEDFMKLGNRNIITVMLDARNFELHGIIYQKPSIYLLLGIDLSATIKSLMNFGSMGSSWNPRGLYVSVAKSKEEAGHLMKSLWKIFVYKVIVLISCNNTSVEAYTWRPYYPHNYCGPPTSKNMIRLGKFTETLQFQKETDIEPGMIPDTFGNCPLNVSFNVWEPYVYPQGDDQNLALEINLIRTVFEKIGLGINPTYHALTTHKEPSEAWAGSRIPREIDVEAYEISIPYIEDYLVWVVPCCDSVYLLNLADVLPPSLWVPSAMAMSIVAISLMASKKQHWILVVWGSLWEQSDYKVPKEIRGIWGCWLFIILHLSVVYKTVLVSRLANPVSEGDIQNQSELLESGLDLGFLAEAEPWFDREDEVHRKILERYIPCQTVIQCYKEIPTGKAVFTNKMFVEYLKGRSDKMGTIAEKVRQMPITLTYKVTMIFAKGHAILPRFDKFLRFTLEAGFVSHWVKRIEESHKRLDMKKFNLTETQELSFVQMSGSFQLLGAGLISAGVLFLYEIIQHLIREKCLSCINEKALE